MALTVLSLAAREKYIMTLSRQLLLLSGAAKRYDIPLVRDICHRIRGSAGMFGLDSIGDICAAAESAAILKHYDHVLSIVESLKVNTEQEVSVLLNQLTVGTKIAIPPVDWGNHNENTRKSREKRRKETQGSHQRHTSTP